MSILQTSPASLRVNTPMANQYRGSFASQSRPYLLNGQKRKSAVSAQECLSLFPHESEDARITGCTRSLYRRLLALNLPGSHTRIQAYAETTFVSGSKIA
jgi:hypothetical protein